MLAAKRKPGRPRSDDAKRAILEAAFSLTNERGYENVTAQMIAETAGAGKQTLYRWWDSKAAIVLDAIAEHGRVDIDLQQHSAIERGDLEPFLVTLFRALKRIGPTLRHLMAEAQRDAELQAALLERLIEPRRRTLRKLLSVRISDARRREAAVTAIYGALWYRLLLGEPLDAKLARSLTELLGLSRG
jgi:AcrR family transcriptional regulator